MINKVLIANRGEVAVRIIRTCRALGLPTVAVFSEADRNSLHVRMADDAVCIGPPEASASYLDGSRIIEAAKRTSSDSIHPGWGFLSENSEFAASVEAAGLIFIGPRPETVSIMGDKTRARAEAIARGLPVIPGYDGKVSGASEAKRIAAKLGYPIMIKAASGGGGRGIRIVSSPDTLVDQVKSAIAEARACFGNGEIFMEKMICPAKHVEVQIFGDGNGNAVHLGERDCSVQRRHQKLIEETPCSTLDRRARKKLLTAAVKLASGLHYRGAGTVEFLVDEHNQYWFMEMNTRLQVEHPVTEMVFNLDIVKMQLELAAGELEDLRQRDFIPRGCAIEARVNAEDEHLMPVTGVIEKLTVPGGPGIRVDTGCYSGYEIPSQYDSMICKIIACAPNRQMAIRRMDAALREFKSGSITTSIPLIRKIMLTSEFMDGSYATTLIEAMKEGAVNSGATESQGPASTLDEHIEPDVAAAIYAVLLRHKDEKPLKQNMVKKVLNRWGLAARHQTFAYRRGF